MSKFQDWIKVQAPAPVVVRGDALKALAKKIGAEVIDLTPDNKLRLAPGSYLLHQRRVGGFFVPKFEYSAIPLKDGELTIRWSHFVFEKNSLVRYLPNMTVYGFDTRVFGQSVFQALGIHTIEVTFPELTVELPVPAWVLSSTEDQWATVYGATVFASEAEEYLSSFTDEFRRSIAAQLAPKPPEPESAGACFCGNPLSPDGHCWVQGCI